MNGSKPKNGLPVQTMPLVSGTQEEESRIEFYPGVDPTSAVEPEDPTRSFPPTVGVPPSKEARRPSGVGEGDARGRQVV